MFTFLDAYIERCVSQPVGALKEHLGTLPQVALEQRDEINRFNSDSEYAEDVEIATIHRVLETLGASVNCGMAETPPLSTGAVPSVRRPKKAETA